LTVLCGGIFPLPALTATSFGINYEVIATDPNLTANCTNDSNANVRQKFFMARYGDPAIRSAVQGELKEMHISGFETIRSIVQLYPGAHPSGDLFNTGNIDASVLTAVGDYVRDIRVAGFKELVLAFGVQGTGSPSCRKSEWGDCFDSATVSASIDAESKIIGAARSVSGVSLRIDLLNEGCVTGVIPPLLKSNFARFIRAASKMHASDFPNVPATVSCQLERTADGLAATRELFAAGGDHVGYFDIHAYPGATQKEGQILLQAAESLKGAKIPIVIGETTYDDPQYRHLIVEAYRAAFNSEPVEILFWPLHSRSSNCNFDVPQPYHLKDAIGTAP